MPKNSTAINVGGYMDEWLRAALRRASTGLKAMPTYYECGICGAMHSALWDGDCRQDDARFTVEQIEARHGVHGWHEIEMEDIEQWRRDKANLLASKFQLQKVRLNGDYDQSGAYWGGHSRGSILYVAFTDTITLYMRAADREAAKQQVRKDYPNARFYR